MTAFPRPISARMSTRRRIAAAGTATGPESRPSSLRRRRTSCPMPGAPRGSGSNSFASWASRSLGITGSAEPGAAAGMSTSVPRPLAHRELEKYAASEGNARSRSAGSEPLGFARRWTLREARRAGMCAPDREDLAGRDDGVDAVLSGGPRQGGSARAIGSTREQAGEPSRLVAALPRRRAPASTPAGLEPRRQGERDRHLGWPPRAPPHGRRRRDCRRRRLGRHGRGRRLGRLGRTGGAPRAGGTRDGGAADELQLELLAGEGLGLPSRRRGQGGPLPSFTYTSSIPDGHAAASGGTVTPRR